MRRKYDADVVSNVQLSTSYSKYKSVMLPLWHSSFRYNSKTYEFMVNGQTGKVGGQFPISPVKGTIAILVFVLVIGLLYLFGGD